MDDFLDLLRLQPFSHVAWLTVSPAEVGRAMELAPVLRCGSCSILDRGHRGPDRSKPRRSRASQLCFALALPCARRAAAGAGPSRTALRAKGQATVATELQQLQLLQRSSVALKELQQEWMEIESTDVSKAEELMQREADLQTSLKDVLPCAA